MLIDLTSPDIAEAAFYTAFESSDLDAMTAVWADAADISCVHPLSATLTGTIEVLESWKVILSAGQRMQIAPRVISRYDSDDLAVHHVHEHIAFGEDLANRSTIIATNVYRRLNDGWRMVLHHGAPVRGAVQSAPQLAPTSVH